MPDVTTLRAELAAHCDLAREMGAWTGEPRQDRADARDLIPEPLIRAALIEDLSGRGDITTLTVIAPGTVTSAAMRARRRQGIGKASILAFRLIRQVQARSPFPQRRLGPDIGAAAILLAETHGTSARITCARSRPPAGHETAGAAWRWLRPPRLVVGHDPVMDNHIAADGICTILQAIKSRASDMDPGLDADRQRACRCQRNENARRTKTAGILVTLLRHGNLLRSINVC